MVAMLKSFTLGRYLDGIFLLTATAHLGEYQEKSISIFSLSNDLRSSRFYLDTKIIQVAEIEENQASLIINAKSILKKDDISEVKLIWLFIVDSFYLLT